MTRSPHPRISEFAAEFDWERGMETEGGRLATDTEVRGDVEGRVGAFYCWYPGSPPMWWSAGVLWDPDFSMRDRKKAKKQTDKLFSEFVDPELRRINEEYQSENADKPAKELRKFGGGLGLGTGGAFFHALGEPPRSTEIMTIVRRLAEVATRIEERLEGSA